MRLFIIHVVLVVMILTLPGITRASGHGPVFGLATPTLGRGSWSLDIAVMNRVARDKQALMLRTMIGYGLTEDLQVSVSLPMPLYTSQGLSQTRGMAMMPANPDVELLLGWRFHRRGTSVGARFESTAYIGFDYPTDSARNGVRTWPGIYTAAVTGYASRSVYLWVSGQYRRYMSPADGSIDRIGDMAMYSLVLGYRPAYFRKDYPHPDWRIFLEVVGEATGKDRGGGMERPDSGGHQVFIGPTLLGLYGSWGVSFGPLLPVYRNLNGNQPEDRVRFVINYTYWF